MTPNHTHRSISPSDARFNILRRLLDGAEFANVLALPWGDPGPIRLPVDSERRDELIRAHIIGAPASVRFAPIDKPERIVRVDALQLGAYSPRADGTCGWIAFDLDGSSHGSGGLREPDRAAAAIAERAATAGLWPGVLIVKSRSGAGRHVWIIVPDAVPMADACLAVAGLAAQARRIADRDALECPDRPHAFATSAGGIAAIAQAGAFELVPKSTERPTRGYVMALPFGGVAAKRGGGLAVDVFGHPARIIEPSAVPACDAWAWDRLIRETRAELARRKRRPRQLPRRSFSPRMHRLDPRTQQLIAGAISEGGRNKAAYYGYRDLVRSGMSPSEAESLIVAGAERCGLPRREAEATLQSARRRWGDRP